MAHPIFRNVALQARIHMDEAIAYAARLDREWPDRPVVMAHLSSQLADITPDAAHVVEFCSGAGALARQLLTDHPTLQVTGLDISAPLIALATAATSAHARRTSWIEADLNQEGWLSRLPNPIHAFVTLQALHDLGDESAVARILRITARLLAPGGRLVYADLLAAAGSSAPGRLSGTRHLELLTQAGLADPLCTLQIGPFGCFRAERRT